MAGHRSSFWKPRAFLLIVPAFDVVRRERAHLKRYNEQRRHGIPIPGVAHTLRPGTSTPPAKCRVSLWSYIRELEVVLARVRASRKPRAVQYSRPGLGLPVFAALKPRRIRRPRDTFDRVPCLCGWHLRGPCQGRGIPTAAFPKGPLLSHQWRRRRRPLLPSESSLLASCPQLPLYGATHPSSIRSKVVHINFSSRTCTAYLCFSSSSPVLAKLDVHNMHHAMLAAGIRSPSLLPISRICSRTYVPVSPAQRTSARVPLV